LSRRTRFNNSNQWKLIPPSFFLQDFIIY
jgi:hypothetical protein